MKMSFQTARLAFAGLALTAIAGAGGYWLRGEPPSPKPAAQVAVPAPAAQSAPRAPLYYQDPDGKPDYSQTPKKTADGRDYRPVYSEAGADQAANDTPKPQGKGRILYYRNPMGLPATSPVPKKDSMGMDYIPVHEGEEESGAVTVSPSRLQTLGVRTAPVVIQAAPTHTVRATGSVQPAENSLAIVSTKFDVVVQRLFVARTGEEVRAGQPLAKVWIDTPDTMMQRGPDVISRQINYVMALQERNPAQIAQMESILRQYGIPDTAIAEIRTTGRATREITITAPRSGHIMEKQAIEGMRINTGDPLFKIANLSSIWVLADIPEQDLGAVRAGQTAQVSFVAFPGRSFSGKVDFIYPMLNAGTRMAKVRIVLPNPDGLLREGMYASASITTSGTALTPALTVPDSAIIDSGIRQVVLVAKGGGRFEPRAVHVGARGNGSAQILDGVKAGEQVVVSANFLIDAESNLRAALATFNGGK
jgi:Cu(I)/Ag(I) efflux system membrane fusion protein